jgi:hypothetical protein
MTTAFTLLVTANASQVLVSSIYDFSVWILSISSRFLAGFIYTSCNIYIMELIENIVWALSGFIPTLVGMEIGWRLASRQTKKPISSPNDKSQKIITVSARHH